MPDFVESQNITPARKTDDVFKTSYGVAHHWRPGYYFPDSETAAKIVSDTTCAPRQPATVKSEDHYATTTGSTHDTKILPETLTVERRPQAPHHWNVHYLNDFRSRYLARHINRPLSPSHQQSETHDAYRAIDGPASLYRPLSMQPFNLDSHHKNGPSQKIIASTRNEELAGRDLYPKNLETFRHLDPYLTTTMRYHRQWTPKELDDVARKDIATYWDLEDYPKAWGFGLHENPMPKDSMPKDRPPMRDKTVFREATDHTRVRPLNYHVPHTGLKSSYQAEYEKPSSILQRTDRICPVETPFILPKPSLSPTYATPMMYQTEYSTIGKCERNLL